MIELLIKNMNCIHKIKKTEYIMDEGVLEILIFSDIEIVR